MFRYGYATVSREDGQTRLSRDIFLGERFLARLEKGQAWRPALGGRQVGPTAFQPCLAVR